MATYTELYDLRSNDVLLNRVTVAVVKKAQTLLDGAPTAAQVTWAMNAISSPRAVAEELFNYVLAANSSATVTAIQNATDAAIQTNIDDAVDVLISGGV